MEPLLVSVIILVGPYLVGIAAQLASQSHKTEEDPVETIQRHTEVARQAMDQASDVYLQHLFEQMHNSKRR